ncbi:MAG: HD-GYP domain-containing protein [candidate division Zixibacteria bacterium]|nr:HD-GYP domain-containing protein [candidate division Zixibacteria bacterium]
MNNIAEQVEKETRQENKENFIYLLGKGKELVNIFYSTLKTAFLYEPNNDAFLKQINPLMSIIEIIIRQEEELSLSTKDGYLFLNQARLRFDFESYVAIRFIMELFQKLKLYKFSLESGIDQEEMQNFIYILVQFDSNVDDPYTSLENKVYENNIKHLHLEKEIPSSESHQILLDKRKLAKKTFFKAISVVKETSQKAMSNKEINFVKVKRVVQSLVDQILQNEEIFLELSSLKNYDEYTYVHSANVCIYSLFMGLRLGLSKRELSELGVASLFHDIGKVKLPLELLNKPTSFNESEWVKMRKHPVIGVKNLLTSLKLEPSSIRAIMVSFEHHLNIDLTGYPQLKDNRELNLYSRIISIADAYDAMTSGRVYSKTPIPPDEALKRMFYSRDKMHDSVLLKFFINMLGVYPVGSLVLLSDGKMGLVIKNNPENLTSPQVKIIADPQGLKDSYQSVDLNKISQSSEEDVESCKIVKCLDPQKYNLDLSQFIL